MSSKISSLFLSMLSLFKTVSFSFSSLWKFLTPENEGKICKSMSGLKLAPKSEIDESKQIWLMSWFGESYEHEYWGIHFLDKNNSVNALTYDNYPPYCYLVYNEFVLTQPLKHGKSSSAYQIQKKTFNENEVKKCLTRSSYGEIVEFNHCSNNDSENQLWELIKT